MHSTSTHQNDKAKAGAKNEAMSALSPVQTIASARTSGRLIQAPVSPTEAAQNETNNASELSNDEKAIFRSKFRRAIINAPSIDKDKKNTILLKLTSKAMLEEPQAIKEFINMPYDTILLKLTSNAMLEEPQAIREFINMPYDSLESLIGKLSLRTAFYFFVAMESESQQSCDSLKNLIN